jgi:hypothetical protein
MIFPSDLLRHASGLGFTKPISTFTTKEISVETATLIPVTEVLTRQQLAAIETPKGTATHKPIPHAEIVEAIITTLGLRKIGVVADQYAVDKTGMKMWGTLDLEAMGDGFRFSIGLKNSHDKSMSLSLIAGYRVMVCHNGCFHGDFQPLMRKHTKTVNLIDAVTLGIDHIQRGWEPLIAQVKSWQERQLTVAAAKLIIYEAFIEEALDCPKHIARDIHAEFFNPRHPEFAERNLFNLQMAFTQCFKSLDPVPAHKATASLAAFLETRRLG